MSHTHPANGHVNRTEVLLLLITSDLELHSLGQLLHQPGHVRVQRARTEVREPGIGYLSIRYITDISADSTQAA